MTKRKAKIITRGEAETRLEHAEKRRGHAEKRAKRRKLEAHFYRKVLAQIDAQNVGALRVPGEKLP